VQAEGDLDGFVKIIADAKQMSSWSSYDWTRCADLIAEAVVSMEFKASAEDISRMSHAS
jgi:dihydrolipoamide dehydrogenase